MGSLSFKIKLVYLLTILFAFSYWASTFYLKIDSNYFVSTNNSQFNNKTATTNQICNPIRADSIQYSVLIDGVQYPTQVSLHKNVSINFDCLDKSSNKKIILFYNAWFGDGNFAIGSGYRTPFKNSRCPVTSCETTVDKKRLNESDLVVVHMRDNIPQLPKYRPTNQRWVFLLHVILALKKNYLFFIFKNDQKSRKFS